MTLSRATDGLNYAVLILLAMAVSIVFTAQAAPAVYATLAKDVGLATGWPLEGVLIAQVASWVFFFIPYDSSIRR